MWSSSVVNWWQLVATTWDRHEARSGCDPKCIDLQPGGAGGIPVMILAPRRKVR